MPPTTKRMPLSMTEARQSRRRASPASARDPLIITIDGTQHEVKVGDTLYFVGADPLLGDGPPPPQSLAIHTTEVLAATSKRLVTAGGFGQMNTTHDKTTNYTHHSVFTYVYSLTKKAALQRILIGAPGRQKALRDKLAQLDANVQWAIAQLHWIETHPEKP